MNNFKTGISIIALIASGVLIYFGTNRSDPAGKSDTAPTTVLESKTDDQGSVTVTVTPEGISETESVWNFSIVMDTHSVELTADLMKSAVLTDDSGKEFQPIAWEGDGPGGHHRNGVLKFINIAPMPKFMELRIEGVGDGIKRSFRWSLA